VALEEDVDMGVRLGEVEAMAVVETIGRTVVGNVMAEEEGTVTTIVVVMIIYNFLQSNCEFLSVSCLFSLLAEACHRQSLAFSESDKPDRFSTH
jgi:hypothetical protein